MMNAKLTTVVTAYFEDKASAADVARVAWNLNAEKMYPISEDRIRTTYSVEQYAIEDAYLECAVIATIHAPVFDSPIWIRSKYTDIASEIHNLRSQAWEKRMHRQYPNL